MAYAQYRLISMLIVTDFKVVKSMTTEMNTELEIKTLLKHFLQMEKKQLLLCSTIYTLKSTVYSVKYYLRRYLEVSNPKDLLVS